MLKIIEITDKNEWDEFMNEHGGHPLQLWGWGELKTQSSNWKVVRLFLKNGEEKRIDIKKSDHSDIVAAAQILIRKLPWPFQSFAYIPRGALTITKKPIERAKISREIATWVGKNVKPKPICLSMEPDWNEGQFDFSHGWRKAKNTVLIPRTLILDLTKTKEELLADIKRKTRYYIKKFDGAVDIRQITDESSISELLEIYHETAKRAGFNLHPDKYYQDLQKMLGKNSIIYAAYDTSGEFEKMVAFSWHATSSKTSFELYGGTNQEGQKLFANYTLKWHIIQDLKARGVERYDLNGLLNDGISNFKKGFARHENMLVGTIDYPLSPLYNIWNIVLPAGKKIIHKIKK